MSDQWEVYPCQMGDAPAFVSFDAGLAEGLHEAADCLLRFQVVFKEMDERGFPVAGEMAALEEVEDLIHGFMEAHGGHYVGSITTGGSRCFHCYADIDEESLGYLTTKISVEHGYDLMLAVTDDPDNEFYWEYLYPTQQDWQLIKDMKIIESLEAHGDTIRTARRVRHFVDFARVRGIAPFCAWARTQGFTVESVGDVGNQARSHRVRLSQTLAPRLEIISHITVLLQRKASEFGGDYDGWTTTIDSPATRVPSHVRPAPRTQLYA